jgi:hypothetical protein
VASYDLHPRGSPYVAVDSSGNGYNAIYGGGTGLSNTINSWAATGFHSIDYAQGFVTASTPSAVPTVAQARTVMVIFNTLDTNASRFFGGWGGGTSGASYFIPGIDSTGYVGIDLTGAWFDGPAVAVNDGRWHVMIATYDGTTLTVYLDGASTSESVALNTGASTLSIDGYLTNGAILGQMAYFGIWNTSLSSADVAALRTDFITKTGIQNTYSYGGSATLASGTATVSTPGACIPSATCVYTLTRCVGNSSTAVGVPTVGTISAGTSFVINSLGAANSVLTGDLASVCWRIN